MNNIEKMFIENEKLVYFVINKYFYNLPKNNLLDKEDWEQIGKLGLFKACKTFNPDKGIAFSTYATKIIKNEILYNIRKNKSCDDILSLDYIYSSDEDERESSLLNILKYDLSDKIIISDYINKLPSYINSNFNERDAKIIKMYIINSNSQYEISKEIGISQAQVARIIKKFKNKYKKDLDIF